MTGLEYMNIVCPTTSVGKDPNREDVADAFEDGVAEGWNAAIEKAREWLENNLSQETSVISGGYVHINFEKVIKKFIKYMEE